MISPISRPDFCPPTQGREAHRVQPDELRNLPVIPAMSTVDPVTTLLTDKFQSQFVMITGISAVQGGERGDRDVGGPPATVRRKLSQGSIPFAHGEEK